LPVWADIPGHSVVIDGYDNTGKFHINYGWGGISDGYYSLNAVNGDTVVFMRINIQPDKGSIGSNEMALNIFTVGKTIVEQYELFSVNAEIRSLGMFPGGQIGTALVDNRGNIVEVVGINNLGESNVTNRTYKADLFLKENVNPGRYKLRIVTRFEGGEWKIVTLSDRVKKVPNSFDFTVNSNPGASGGGYGLALEVFDPSKTTVSQNEAFTVGSKLKNVSQETFPSGYLGAALVDNNGNIVAVVGTFRHTATRAPGEAYVLKTIDCKVPDTVQPGQYKPRTVVRPIDNEEWRVATLAFDGVPTAFDFTVK